MALELSKELPHFKASQHLLGCVGHVVNLAAQAGLKALGSESLELVQLEGADEIMLPTKSLNLDRATGKYGYF